jgi:hypothetical protein
MAIMTIPAALAWLFLAAAALTAQSLRGVVDLHVHSDPDSVPRSIGAIEVARLAKNRGMRAILLKNHYESTASLAWIVRSQAPGIEVFGGIALNRTVGGINPAAVARMAAVKGGYGRVVWMPTFDSENQVRRSAEKRPFVPISRDGRLLPDVLEVLDLIAKHNLTLATGHSTPAEALLLISEARRRGVARIIATHAMLPPVSMNAAEMKQAAAAGAWIEFVYNALIGHTKVFEWPEYAAAIRTVGPDHVILTSDLGQAGNPLHPNGLAAFFDGLAERGFTPAEIGVMSRDNPARALGLEP